MYRTDVDRIAVSLIGECVKDYGEYVEASDVNDRFRLSVMAEISGIIAMAEAVKEAM